MLGRCVWALLFALLIGCQSAKIQPHSLVGSWRYADAAQSCRYDFRADGTFRGEFILNRKPFSIFEGKWSVTDDTLNYQYTHDSLGRIAAGAVDRDKILHVDSDAFVIRAADGSERKYLRMQSASRESAAR